MFLFKKHATLDFMVQAVVKHVAGAVTKASAFIPMGHA